jgi:hypothetical protein
MKMYLLFLSLFFCKGFAQNSISGTVTDDVSQFWTNIKVVGGTAGTVTDSEGKFSLNSSNKLPYVIEISSGFISKQVNITTNNQKVNILLKMSKLT